MLNFHFWETLVCVDTILQDLFQMKTVLIPLMTTWAFLWGFGGGGWVYSVATWLVGALQKISELSIRFQISSYTYILQMQRLMQKNWFRTETYFKSVVHARSK